MSPRPYNSAVRSAQAQATRRALLAAARRVFAERGYSDTTVEAVAAAAGVSVPTVYALFGSKPGLLSAVVRDAGSEADIRALAAAALTEPAPVARIKAAARVVRTIMQREWPLLQVLADAGLGRPELRALTAQVHDQQRGALERSLEGIPLRHDVSRAQAAATFALLASPESYRQLVEELGWEPDRWESWLAETAARLLLPGPG